ncbi:MAG: 4-alpha-glucanotransferase [Bacilli bacterium]|nr:4-alpha-glucanotransferase [Bacilli bacterium]
MKRIGILAPLFSLPNQYGIGDFSESTYQFIDFLARIKYSCWQILPLNPTDIYGSPYTSLSSFALDEIYVSLPDLKKRGLITDFKIFSAKSKRVNYIKVRRYKNFYFNIAFNNFTKLPNAQETFIKIRADYPRIYQYAQYKVLRRINGSPTWNHWEKQSFQEHEYEIDINREIFKQYILFKQWEDLHTYAKLKGITIIGDLPFYVGFDSADVFFNRDAFYLDEKNNPIAVAGVPPDYYSQDGQLWGNPIYDWDYLRENKFNFVLERIINASEIYDVVRLDHFRAFDTYYMIPNGAETARIGEWKEAPGYEFFDYLYSVAPEVQLIAEDLGEMREEVYHLRDHYNLPGMQVIQFTFVDEELRHSGLPYVCKRDNSIIYISTHDSSTGMSWLEELDEETRWAVYRHLDETYGHHHVMTNLFKYVVSQPAETVILAISDILRLGKYGRINIPGSKYKYNWTFRLSDYTQLMKNEAKLVKLATESGRSA